MSNYEKLRSYTNGLENESILFIENQLQKIQLNRKKFKGNLDRISYFYSDFILMTQFRVTLIATIEIIGVILKR